ncbi:MAG TPA: citrate synthase [Gemmatimonadota bacterium]|nr:citrate synthase [Gemmatimonadota bacterium]
MANTLTVTDNRTGKSYEIPISYGTYPEYGASIPTADLRQIRASEEDFGLLGYDPAFKNTASCKSAITHIDGERGILRYRSCPIEELAESAGFLEVAYLVTHGELPTADELEAWTHEITYHTYVHESIKKFTEGFHYDAHPMGMLVSTVAALSTFYPEARDIADPEVRRRQIVRLIAKMPTLAAFAYRHSKGLPYVYPDNDLAYAADFLTMMFSIGEPRRRPDPVLVKALEVLFILHVDHEQNCSANAMRSVGSSHADPYVSVAAAAAALYGPLHGGANEQVLRMLREIGTKDRVPEFVEKAKSGDFRLMGFGHRVYKNYDPRAKILKGMAREVLEVTGSSPLLELAMELEKVALEDEYFVSRKLYPNVDFYSGIIYQAMGFPVDMFPVLFAIPRTAGWLAQWEEMLTDPEQRIARPRQVYTGADERHYVPIGEREAGPAGSGARGEPVMAER